MSRNEAAIGLTEAEAQARLRAEGFNDLPKTDHRTFLRIIGDVLREPMFALLLGAGVIYLVLGDLTEALMLLVFATISVSITVVQELRSERVLEALRDMTSPRALVIRDGVRRRIPGREVVRGDAVVVLEGDRVPADAVVVAASNLLVDESLLTGEAIPVRKSAGTAGAAMARPGGEDLPFVFSGTLVVGGEGVAVVRSTGAASEIGRIGQALGRIAPEPPRLQQQTRRLVRNFAAVGMATSLLAVLLYGFLRGDWLEGDPGRDRARHVDAAGGVPPGADGVHGDGCLASVAGPRADAPRRRHRDAGVGHRPVHRQDRHAHREPHDDRRTADSGGGRRPGPTRPKQPCWPAPGSRSTRWSARSKARRKQGWGARKASMPAASWSGSTGCAPAFSP